MAAFGLIGLSGFLIAFFYPIYCICVGNFDTSTYYLPLKLAPPFNIDSVHRWYLFWALQVLMNLVYGCGTTVVTAYFVCCCFYLGAYCDHFDYLVTLIDAEFDQNQSKSNEQVNCRNPLNALKLYSNMIDHHNKIYE